MIFAKEGEKDYLAMFFKTSTDIMTKEEMISHLRTVPDFPVKGIKFWDITTLMKDAECLRAVVDDLYEEYKDKGITKVVGIESRGFVIGPALAARLGAGFVMARKMGKLPSDSLSETYTKEYGLDTIEIHKDAITEDDVCLLHDDLLATGGTMAACLRLVDKFHPVKSYMSFVIDIYDCPRIPEFPDDVPVYTVLKVSEK